jgi:diguanylate cyclase (GGDEF)-like protein
MPLEEQPFVRELEGEVERAKRGSRRLSILVGQLGSPGQYAFVGQRSGDPLLDRIGEALESQNREVDVVAMLGQGRFAVIMPETGEPGALIVAERLRAALASLFREHPGAPNLGLGVASLGRHGRSAGALLGAAERAAVADTVIDRPVASG